MSFDLHQPTRIHIIAIGGAAMSAIATILHTCGHVVTGSDQSDSAALAPLRELGIEISVGHHADNVAGTSVVLHSAAVKPGNEELEAAKQSGIPCLSRSDAMEIICAGKRVLAVSGAHGKTTTSSMLATVLVDAGENPSFLVGTTVARFGSGVRWTDDSDWLVLEADESDGSFLRAHAEAIIVTNADPDHLDYWGSESALLAGYETFIRQSKLAVVCRENEGSRSLIEQCRDDSDLDRMHTYGWGPGGDWNIIDYRAERLGSRFVIDGPQNEQTAVVIRMPGDHNALNATAVFALARRIGIPAEVCAQSLAAFGGIARRFEFRGEFGGVTFVDDYAHLPAEVASTLSGARSADWQRIIAVFQPHRYTRVQAVGVEFGPTFGDADVVIITGLYAAGQQPIPGISGRTVFDAVDLARPGREQHYCETRAEVVRVLSSIVRSGDLVLTMNAGDLTTLPDEMLVRMASGQ